MSNLPQISHTTLLMVFMFLFLMVNILIIYMYNNLQLNILSGVFIFVLLYDFFPGQITSQCIFFQSISKQR
jgi:hypothetical protein